MPLGAVHPNILTARLALGPFAQYKKPNARLIFFASNAASRTRGVVMDSGLDACASPRNDGGILEARFRIPAARNARVMHRVRPRNIEGAGNAGCWPHPWPACNKKRRRQSPQVSRNSPAFPARWFERLLRTLPGVPGLLAPVTGAFVTHQLDLSVGRSGPYDLAVRA